MSKPVDQFHRNAGQPDGLQKACKACRSQIDAVSWQRVRERRLAQRRIAAKALMLEVREYKANNPCVGCGQRFHPVAMQFDHLPGEKKYMEISALWRNGRKRVWAEIAKCDLVCANCHAVRTFTRRKEAVEDVVGLGLADGL